MIIRQRVNNLLILFIFVINFINSCHSACLPPAIPENGKVEFTRAAPYIIGTRAKYICDVGFIHLGSEERICGQDNMWTHATPLCATNVALYKPTTQSSTLRAPTGQALSSRLAVDGVMDGACATTLHEANANLVIDLLSPFYVYAVELLLHVVPNANVQINIEIWLETTNTGRQLCTRYKGNLESNVLHTFVCDSSATDIGRVIISTRDNTLQLCEVLVLSTLASSAWQCGLSADNLQTMGVLNGQCYAIATGVNNQLTWIEAQNSCLRHGATLPLHVDDIVQSYLASQLTHRALNDRQETQIGRRYWIGLLSTKSGNNKENTVWSHQRADWKWVDGLTLDSNQTHWSPDNSPPSSPNAAVTLNRDSNWLWNQQSQDEPMGWMCQSSPRYCSSPGVPWAGGVMISRQPFDVGTTAYYYCSPGTVLVGSEQRMCQHDGRWSGVIPQCNSVDCGLVATPKFGRAAYVNGSQVFGTLVRYTCNNGYMLAQGQMQRKCGEQGKWEGTQPSCQPVHCPTALPPLNGTIVTTTGSSVGSIVRFECIQNYRLDGTNTQTCTSEGEWQPEIPRCVPKTAVANSYVESKIAINSGSGDENLQTQINWLILAVVAVMFILVLVSAIAIYIYRRRKPMAYSTSSTNGSASSTVYALSPDCHQPNNEYGSAYGYLTANAQSQYASPSDLMPNNDGVTELVVPPHLLRMQQLPNGNLHLTLPHQPKARSSLAALTLMQSNVVVPIPVADPPIQQQTNAADLDSKYASNMPYERPKKFQTLVTKVKQRLNTDQSKTRRFSMQDPQQQNNISNPVRVPSPTPSDVLYKFNDGESDDDGDDRQAPGPRLYYALEEAGSERVPDKRQLPAENDDEFYEELKSD